MAVEQINWYLRENCNANPRCDYCFETVASKCQREASFSETDLRIAEVLADSGVRKVTLTGGEPLLSVDVVKVSERLHSSGIRVSLHTNGLLLSDEKLDQLAGVVDVIGLSIDSVNPNIQASLRSQEFVDKVSSRISDLTEDIRVRGMGVEYHTVFNWLNAGNMRMTYRRLKNNDFSQWKIYEQNFDLGEYTDGTDGGTIRYGGTDGLQANFLLTEDKFRVYGDKRVSFLSQDDRRKYFFLGQGGEIMFRRSHFLESLPIGNILVDNFEDISTRWDEFNNGDPDKSDIEQFWQRQEYLPFFKRYYWGFVSKDEMVEIDGRSCPRIERLADLYGRHESE